MPLSPEEKFEIIQRARESVELCDRVLADRRDPDSIETIIPFRKPEPEPKLARTFTDSEISRLAHQVADDARNRVTALRDEFVARVDDLNDEVEGVSKYVSVELGQLLTTVFGDVAAHFDEIYAELKGVKTKFIESDIEQLRADVGQLRSNFLELQATVSNLALEVASLRDALDSIDRSAKVVALR